LYAILQLNLKLISPFLDYGQTDPPTENVEGLRVAARPVRRYFDRRLVPESANKPQRLLDFGTPYVHLTTTTSDYIALFSPVQQNWVEFALLVHLLIIINRQKVSDGNRVQALSTTIGFGENWGGCVLRSQKAFE
jgi:hypothetical protein